MTTTTTTLIGALVKIVNGDTNRSQKNFFLTPETISESGNKRKVLLVLN